MLLRQQLMGLETGGDQTVNRMVLSCFWNLIAKDVATTEGLVEAGSQSVN